MASTDTEINDLRAQVEAYRTKMSLLQQEVSLIFDKSDKIELLRARELEEACKTRDHFEIKLQKYKAYVKQLERERDDLRDSVTEFVDKVESNPSALSLWPRSHMEMKSFPDPVSRLDKDKVLVDTPELLSYAAARITSLTQQRDLERKNFRQMQHLFEAQVRTLQAQVARRDATIAACQEHASHHIADPVLDLNTGIKGTPTALPLSDEQIIKALRRTMENNHALETEVRILGQELERVKEGSARPVSTSLIIPRMGSALPEVNVIPDSRYLDPNSALRTVQTQMGSERLEPKIPESYTLFNPLNPSSLDSTPLSNADIFNRPHLPQIDALDHQIDYLSSKIDAFREERNLLKEVLVLQQSDLTSDGTLHLATEPKPIPGPSQYIPSETRSEPRVPLNNALVQEQGSRKLKTETSPSPDPNTRHPDAYWSDYASHEAQDRLPETPEDYDVDGEISMELATPLTPSNIVLPDGFISRSSQTQSPIGSNEEIPRMIRPRILPSPLPGSSPNSPTQCSPPRRLPMATTPVTAEAESDLENLRQELLETRQRLQERDEEVADLRAMLQTLNKNEGA